MLNKTSVYKLKYKHSKKGKLAEARYRKNNQDKIKVRAKEYAKNNPEKIKQYQLRYNKKVYYKNPRKCKICGQIIPYGTGSKFCSNECKIISKHLNQKKLREKQIKLFSKYKEETGCAICGYNKYGGSLDFHHVNPKDKKFRLDANRFYSMSKETLAEFYKCILLCKNCHYEIHSKENGDLK